MNIFVLILRIIVPLVIFRHPLFGAFLSILLDSIDWPLTNFNTPNSYEIYQLIDKTLDMYYLSIEAVVFLSLKDSLIKRIGIFLFIFRLIGFILFEITQIRLLLVAFPNLFEFVFIYYFAYLRIKKMVPNLGVYSLNLLLFFLFFPKMLQEYSAHIEKRPPWEWELFALVDANIFNYAYLFIMLALFLYYLRRIFLVKQKKQVKN